MRLRLLALFLITLLPSVYYAWHNADVPEFGRFHDDGLLYVSAKSIASGEGFRILSLPEQPAQTKYPILYPLYLAAIWKLNPNFPANLSLVRLFSLPLLVLCISLSWILLRKEGLSEGRTMIVVALLGLNPYMIVFGCNIFSEIFFMCWVLGVCLAARSENLGMAVFAGVLAGCAYLARTAGIVLLVSVPLWYVLNRRDYRRPVLFAAGMIPFIAGWSLWSRANMLHSMDPTLVYYTDYIRYQFLNVGLDNLHVVVWKNVDGILYGMGALLIPKVFASLPMKILTQVIGVAMISGTIRLVRRRIATNYALFGAALLAMLLVWHFPANERFVIPLLPLFFAGLICEVEHIVTMLRTAFRHKDLSQRVVAGVLASALVAIFGGAIAIQIYMTTSFMPLNEDSNRAKLRDSKAAYDWIRENLPTTAKILNNDDPLLYLYSGHTGNAVPLVPRFWYSNDHSSTIAAYREIPAYCRQRGFEYFYSSGEDTVRWTDDPNDVAAVRRAIEGNPELKPVFRSGFGTVYRVQPVSR